MIDHVGPFSCFVGCFLEKQTNLNVPGQFVRDTWVIMNGECGRHKHYALGRGQG